MTICNKIQKVGETMETNLNARGVSCTFGTGTGESTVLDMVEMVNSTNFKGSSDVNLKIGANRPYLLTGETTDVVVKLENGLCEPLKNKNVVVGQSIFQDGGTTTSHNDHYWTISSYGTITRQTNDTKILNTSGTNSYIGYYVVPMDKTINETNTYSFNAPCIIEFDITDTSNSTVTNCNFQIYSNTTSDYVMEDITTSRIGHWKIIWGETEQKVYVDDTLIGTYNKTLTNARITFRARNNYYLCFKNLKIYKTINGVTDEKGEFALYDVSVTDDTTFTATYSNVSAICKVFPCLIVDYGVTENYSNLFNVMTMFTRQSDGTKFYYENTGSSTYQVYTSQVSITDEVGIDFELIECTSCLLQVARYKTGASTEYLSKTITSKGKVHIEINTTGTYIYLNDALIQSETEQTNMESVRLFFRVASNNIANFKYRNLGIYYRG